MAVTIYGQTPSGFRAIQWGLQNGLSQAETYFMLKDANGFLWIETKNGLNRFDGASFRIYTNDRNNINSLPSNMTILGIKEDSLHNVWIGNEKGLSRYDIRADTFTRFSPGALASNSGSLSINPFSATRNDIYCIESEAFITSYNIKTFDKKIHASLTPYELLFPGPSAGYSVLDPGSNSVWINIFDPKKDQSGLLKISLRDGKKEFYEMPLSRKRRWAGAEAMVHDVKRNLIWINSYEGLLRFDLKKEQFQHLPALRPIENIPDYDRFVGIDLDPKGNVWFATYPKGIIIYNPDQESFKIPFYNDPVSQQHVSEYNACIYADRDGIVWSGFWLRKGISQIMPFIPAAKLFTANNNKAHSLSSDYVVTAVYAGQNRIWLGTDNGLNIFDPETESFEVLKQKDLPGLKTESYIHIIRADTIDRKAWLKTDAGLYIMDMKSRRCRKLTNTDSAGNIIPEPAFSITDDYIDGLIHISFHNDRMIVSDLESDTILRQVLSFPKDLFNPFIITATNSHLLLLRARGDSGNQTFAKINDKWIRIHTAVDSIRWHQIMFNDTDSTYWVSGERQLIHYDKNFRLIRRYDQSNGLPETDFSSLIADNYGNIWFHTEWSVHHLDIKTGRILTLSERDGFENQDFTLFPFSCKDGMGNIYFPKGLYGKGLLMINPSNFSSPPSFVYFQSLQINQGAFPLTTSINSLDNLSLRYNQQNIELETGIIDYFAKGKSRIRYKLEGKNVSETWHYGQNYTTIRYDGLKPGQYRLTVQASNAANEFNGPEKILNIQIASPYWETWWFRILAVLVFISIMYGFVQYRSRNLKKQNLQLENNVKLRTRELNDSIQELRDTQAQLIHSEKMASLGELTAGIAHEIQNPLNFVNNFSEINSELTTELKVRVNDLSITDEEKSDVTAIIDDIGHNEQKINYHGKRADAIVKSMLEHSRARTGVKSPSNLNALVDEYIRLSYNGLRAKDKSFNATLKTSFDNSIGLVEIIPQDLGRVLLNMYNNAYYAVMEKRNRSGPAFEPIVTVSTLKTGRKVEIRIRDNGTGIPEKVISKIFQPFFTTKPTGQGTGLGLSLSYDIIKAHGGELKVDTREGEWTEFVIELPC
jgi:signal transduction histidine kinase/ligand-binding sensor domain-containing protein